MACESSGSSDRADTGVYLRLYSANGTAFGVATRIDGRLLRNPEVAVSGNGFVVAAHSDAIYAQCVAAGGALAPAFRWEVNTSEIQSLMRIPYAVFCLKTNNTNIQHTDGTSQII